MLHIGVVGTGRIAQRFIAECKMVSDVEVSAIYNPRLASVKYFAETNQIDETQVLLTDDKEKFADRVDAVYIAAPHEYHYEYAKEFLSAGKHVLCEKPMVTQGEQAMELFELAKKQNVILMEAVKTASSPGFIKLLQLLERGVIGQPYDVEACFTKIGSAAGREIWGVYGGSFVELGNYPLLPVVKIFGTNSRESYIWSLDNAVGTDSYTKMVISYGQATATLKTGLGVKSEGELIIAGESGYIKVPSPWWLTKKIEVHHENPNQVEVYEAPFEGAGLRYEIVVFAERIRSFGQDADEVAAGNYVTPQESIWMAYQMEHFLSTREPKVQEDLLIQVSNGTRPNIWAHRGCSMAYPENTLLSFQKAAEIKGITGIELDVQLTKDGEMVVIHDEKVDRTTTGTGHVKDYTLKELKELRITPSGGTEPYMEALHIPTLWEVFELLEPFCKQNHLMINIELKNSQIRYEGMEQKVIDLVAEFELEDNIVYSSFLHESVGLVKQLNPQAKTGTLAGDLLDCLEGARTYGADALHPSNIGMAINPDTVAMLRDCEIPVRMWNSEEPLFGQSRILKECDLNKYVLLGATDIITNVPEKYLQAARDGCKFPLAISC